MFIKTQGAGLQNLTIRELLEYYNRAHELPDPGESLWPHNGQFLEPRAADHVGEEDLPYDLDYFPPDPNWRGYDVVSGRIVVLALFIAL